MKPQLLLINPWIYDFAAYDLWAKPLGLLYLAEYLRRSGFGVNLIDCLDVHHPLMTTAESIRKPKRRQYGTGKYWRRQIIKPDPLKHIQRPYSRYGLDPRIVTEELKKIKHPAAILITSLMTYWYPGVQAIIKIAKAIHPGVPVILGGIYARLCTEHAAKTSGADCIVTGGDPDAARHVLEDLDIFPPGPNVNWNTDAYPAFDLLHHIDYICLMTSTGCPYRCRYCASHFLTPIATKKKPDAVANEIQYWHRRYGVRDFAFYDDALLMSSETHMVRILEKLLNLNLNIRFHTPNALHVKEITGETARLMFRTGFRTIRLGVETSDFSYHRQLDNKLHAGDLERAVTHLLKAGFSPKQIGAYILVGLPDQSVDSVYETISYVAKLDVIPYLSEYSPLPHTDLWEDALAQSRYPLATEPLFQNSSLLPCWDESKKEALVDLKKRIMEIRGRHR